MVANVALRTSLLNPEGKTDASVQFRQTGMSGPLLGSGGFRRSLLPVAFIEPIHASCSVNQLLLTGEKRVTCGTDFDVQVAFFRRTGLKNFPASAGYCYLVIVWMNSWFHCLPCLAYRQLNAVFFKRAMIGCGACIVKRDNEFPKAYDRQTSLLTAV